MTDNERLASLLFALFRGREDRHATATDRGFRPTRRALRESDLLDHVEGRTCYGFYVTRADNSCLVSAVDFDGKHEADWRERAGRVHALLRAEGYSPLAEISQSGEGAHVWLFHDAIDAAAVRRFWKAALARAGVRCREVFPKQDALPEGGYGNLIRYPLWGKSCFAAADWQPVPPAEALGAARRHTAAELARLVPPAPAAPADAPAVSPRVQRVIAHGTGAARWGGSTEGLEDRSRSGVAASLACLLIRAYVPTPEIEDAVRVWAEEQGAIDKARRPDWVRRTVASAYDYVASRRDSAASVVATLRDCALDYLASLSGDKRGFCVSGISSLDDAMEGTAFGELALVAARPSHGKSAFGIQWADCQSYRGVPVLFLSEEMSRRALGARCVARIVKADGDTAATAEARARIEAHFGAQAPIYVRQACYTIDRAEDVIAQHVEQDGVRAVVVDYAQILRSQRARQRNEEVAEVSIRLRHVTTQFDLATLACCQLNREIERRGGRARLSDLGDSGQLERDADLVLALRWPWKDDPSHEPRDEFLISVLKRRNGPIRQAEVVARFNDTTQTIY